MSEKLQCRAQWRQRTNGPVTRWWGLWRGTVSIPVVITCRLEEGHDDQHGGWIMGIAGDQPRKLHVRW